MARYKIKLKVISECELLIEADSVEVAVYKATDENQAEIAGTNEVISKEAIGASLIEETATEQELPSSD